MAPALPQLVTVQLLDLVARVPRLTLTSNVTVDVR